MTSLPGGWVRARIVDVAHINPTKMRPDYSERTELVFVPMARVAEQFGGIDISWRRPFASIQRGYTQFRPKDVLFAKITPCMENGKIAIVPSIQPPLGYGSTEFFVIRPQADGISPWIAHALARSEFRQLGVCATGVAYIRREPSRDPYLAPTVHGSTAQDRFRDPK